MKEDATNRESSKVRHVTDCETRHAANLLDDGLVMLRYQVCTATSVRGVREKGEQPENVAPTHPKVSINTIVQ